MSKVNIANYVVHDLANRFNCIENNCIDSEIVGIVAESWHKKHFISNSKSIKYHHKEDSSNKFMI